MQAGTNERRSGDAFAALSVRFHGNKLLIWLVAIAALTGLVAALNPGWLLELDQPLSDRALRAPGSDDFWVRVSYLGMPDLGIALAVLSVVFLRKRCRRIAFVYPAVVAVGVFVDNALKIVVDRPRPAGILIDTALGSFPSGHTIQVVAIVGFLPLVVRVLTRSRLIFWSTWVGFMIIVAAVGFSRIRLGAHWPSDIAASYLIGSALVIAGRHAVATESGPARCKGCPLHAVSVDVVDSAGTILPGAPGAA